MRSALVNFKKLLHYNQHIWSRWSSPPYCWSENPQVFLAIKMGVLSFKVISDWIIVIMRSSKIPSFIYLQNKTCHCNLFSGRKQKISPSFLTILLTKQVKIKIYIAQLTMEIIFNIISISKRWRKLSLKNLSKLPKVTQQLRDESRM